MQGKYENMKDEKKVKSTKRMIMIKAIKKWIDKESKKNGYDVK